MKILLINTNYDYEEINEYQYQKDGNNQYFQIVLMLYNHRGQKKMKLKD